jgi:hypothetical protein
MKPYFLNDPVGELWLPSKAYTMGVMPESKGIVQIRYNHNPSVQGWHYHPTLIAASALKAYNIGDTATFQRYGQWLVENLNKDGLWTFDFDWKAPGYLAKAPWACCMTQGMGLSVLARMDGISEAISRATLGLWGLVCEDRGHGGYPYFEGVPSPIGARILNEELFAIIGLIESGSEAGGRRMLGDIRLERFELRLPLFKWTRYDNKWCFYSGEKYHKVQMQQLAYLGWELENKELIHRADGWQTWDWRYGLSPQKRLFELAWGQYIRGLEYIMMRGGQR